jgi:hypothetical protein
LGFAISIRDLSMGVVRATAGGVLLTGLYVGTGTLWLPMVLHALLDLRVAILPASSRRVAQAQPAASRACLCLSLRPSPPRFQLFAKQLDLLVGNLNLPVESDCQPAGADVTKLDTVKRRVVLNGGRKRGFEVCAFL